ncbi:MAG: TetR/AcrR family transcriptional regulator [Chloroflexota bacterium]
MISEQINESRERVLDAAEVLFMEGGYAAIKIKHIAHHLKMKESSLYYHFPKGKQQLYVAVMRRNLQRHKIGIEQAIREAGDDWVEQLRAVAYWLISQPPIDVMRMNKADLPAIEPDVAEEITEYAYQALNLQIREILDRGAASGEAVVPDNELLAGVFISMISTLDIIKTEWNEKTKHEMADVLIQTWINGLHRR